jgi:hypothetical protein
MSRELPPGWVEVSPWCIRSDDGRFTICKYGIADDEYRYELWKGKDQLSVGMPTALDATRLHLSIMDSSQEAGPKSPPSQTDGDQTELFDSRSPSMTGTG